MSWFPSRPTPPSERRRAWRAPSLPGKDVDVARLTYVVVHEIVGDAVVLSLSAWPRADPKGRLRFEVDGDPTYVSANVHELCEFLDGRGLQFVPPHEDPDQKAPHDPGKRVLRIGTVFAAELRGTRGTRWTKPLDRWIGQIHDITRDARYVAKLVLYGALTDKWEQREAEKLRLVRQRDEED